MLLAVLLPWGTLPSCSHLDQAPHLWACPCSALSTPCGEGQCEGWTRDLQMLAEDDDLNNDSPVFQQTLLCHRLHPPRWITEKLAQWQAGAGVETRGLEEGQRGRSHLAEQGSLEAWECKGSTVSHTPGFGPLTGDNVPRPAGCPHILGRVAKGGRGVQGLSPCLLACLPVATWVTQLPSVLLKEGEHCGI